MMPVPVSVITGPLGVGKTTAILDLLRQRGDGRWAVLVNEFGRVGIDGAVLAEGGVEVRELPGGCVCCAQGPQLQVALVRILRELRPARLLIEPSGLALPGAILDLLRRPGIAEAVAVRATITLVDAARFAAGAWRDYDADHAQVDAADVLVGNRADRATAAELDAFRAAAAELWPPKAVVATTSYGALDPAWLDLDPTPRAPSLQILRHADHAASERGWVWPVEAVFDRGRALALVQSLLLADGPLGVAAARVKGLLRTERGWLRLDGVDERVEVWPFQRRTDSRLEVIAPPAADWAAVEAAVEAARLR